MDSFWSKLLWRFVNVERFLRIVGGGLILVAAVKGMSLFREIYLFELEDPILKFVSIWQMTLTSALTEVGVGLFLIRGKSETWRLVTVGILSHVFVLYRIGLLLVGYDQPCSCYGTLLGWMPERVEEWLPMFFGAFLLFMIVGTYGFGGWLLRIRTLSCRG